MPARDVNTPHLLASSTSPVTSTGHLSPSGSHFSQVFGDDPSRSSHPESPGLAARLLRRVSADRSYGGIMIPSHDAEAGTPNSRSRHDAEHGESSTASHSTSHAAIRESSNRLASLSFASRPRRVSASSMTPERHLFLHSVSPRTSTQAWDHPGGDKEVRRRPSQTNQINQAVSPIAEEISPPKHDPSPNASAGTSANAKSALSVMMEQERYKERRASAPPIPETSSDGPTTRTAPLGTSLRSSSRDSALSGSLTPRGPVVTFKSPPEEAVEERSDTEHEDSNDSSGLRRYLAAEVNRDDQEPWSERTPLLGKSAGKKVGWPSRLGEQIRNVRKATAADVARAVIVEPVKTLPAVVLGLLLNVLDGVSYGMILFPANAAFVDFGSLGVSMYFMSCIVSQLVFSLGGSIFPGGNGSMMIEALPFFHILVNIIEAEVGDDIPSVVATTMASFAFSSILTGLVFFALGFFKLGALVGYFPRHILVGCIGGVGIFLLETGLEVSRGLKEEGFAYNLDTLKLFFSSPNAIALWTVPLGLAIVLRILTHFFHHQLVFPMYFFVIPVVFYIVIAIGGWDLALLRTRGWVFDVGETSQAWWKFYTLFVTFSFRRTGQRSWQDFGKTNWTAFWAAMPTQLALVFFGILHVPLNVPALGVSLREDNVKLDRELVAHGFSNLAAGLTGTVPNYLTYVNTVVFYRVGGGSRLSGVMLAAATAAVMFVGPSVISYLPVPLVGALIFVLGLDLAIEAVWDTRHRVNRMEYITIWAIAIGMTLWDFVIGLLFGIILACIFFVYQNSRRRAIRAVFSGATAKSTVRRPRSQRAFIQQVGSQTYVMKLQGFLFFGTITHVEGEIRKLLELALWQHNPIRFLIIDFTLVHGLDFSSAEAFVRVQRLLSAKDVMMILCGAAPNGPVAPALRAVDLWADREGTRVEVFAGLNDALEWTENAYLTAFYETHQKALEVPTAQTIDFPKVAKPPFSIAESFENSPRRRHLVRVGDDTLPRTLSYPAPESPEEGVDLSQPIPLLMETLGAYMDSPSASFFASLAPFFVRTAIHGGEVLWHQNDLADGLYFIEVGSLRATYHYGDQRKLMQETMVAGTVAGDLSTLSDTKRNATVVAERDCVLWRMDREGLRKLESENAECARIFIQVVLKAVAEEHDVLSSHLIAVLS